MITLKGLLPTFLISDRELIFYHFVIIFQLPKALQKKESFVMKKS